MKPAHIFMRDELQAGDELAEAFLAKLATGAVEPDALERAFERARLGSRTRSHAFCATLQEALKARRHD